MGQAIAEPLLVDARHDAVCLARDDQRGAAHAIEPAARLEARHRQRRTEIRIGIIGGDPALGPLLEQRQVGRWEERVRHFGRGRGHVSWMQHRTAASQQRVEHLHGRRPESGEGVDQHQAAHDGRVVHRQLLRHQSAQADPENMGRPQLQPIQQRSHIGSEKRHRVAAGRLVGGAVAAQIQRDAEIVRRKRRELQHPVVGA